MMPPGLWRWIKEPELLAYDFDAQAFLLAAHDVYGGEFAALDTLQHGLARHAERAYRFAHWKKVVAGLAGEAGPEIFGQSDPPRGAGCQLLAGDDAVIEQAMNGRGSHAECDGGLPDRHELALGRIGGPLAARNTPVAAQIADTAGGEAMAVGRGAALPIEDAGDDAIGIMDREAAYQRDRVLSGAHSGRP